MEGRAPSAIEPRRVRLDRDLSPAEHGQALLGGRLLDRPADVGRLGRVAGEEGDAGGVVPGRGQLEVDAAGVEIVWDLEEDPGAVAAVLLATGGPPVGEVLESGEGATHELVAGLAVQIGHQGHPAGVVLEAAVVETAGGDGRPAGSGDGRAEPFVPPSCVVIGPLQRETGSPARDDAGPCAVHRWYPVNRPSPTQPGLRIACSEARG